MAYIFTDIGDLKEYIGSAVNASMDLNELAPSILNAYNNHLRDKVPHQIWTKFVQKITDGDNLNSEEEKLLPFLKRCIAHLTMLEYMQLGNIMVSDAGAHRVESEDRKTPFKYQENEYKKSMLNNGYNNIELLLLFLNDNEDDYSDWKESDEQKRSKELFISSASTMRQIYSHNMNRFTYETIRPLLDDNEYFTMKYMLGVEMYQSLKEKILEGTTDELEKKILAKSQKLIAYFTMDEALAMNWIRLEGKDVVYNEELEPQSFSKAAAANRQQIEIHSKLNRKAGNRYADDLRAFLDKNISALPLYKSHIDAQADKPTRKDLDTKSIIVL